MFGERYTPLCPKASDTSFKFTWDDVDLSNLDPYVYHIITYREILEEGTKKMFSRVNLCLWTAYERIHKYTPIGERILIRRDFDGDIICDYISTRVDEDYRWTQELVRYHKDNRSPYPHTIDVRLSKFE